MTTSTLGATFVFDARGIAKRFRHAAIFAALESLDQGETMRFVNDHDPLPLLAQIRQRYGDQVRIQYVERSPERVAIDFGVCLGADQGVAAEDGPEASCGGGHGGCGCAD
jgi:uncharacterized protein (DUF2249 family)